MNTLRLDFKKMRDLREAKEMSMREAGEKAKLGSNPAQRWYSLESGTRVNVKLDTLARIAHALGVNGKELITS